ASDQTLGYQTFKEATIAMKEGQLSINVDGDEGEALPITVKVLPQHLQVYR
ncbi:TPA: diacylglycerol kinase family lipid kinase, partial [Streptococcus equi subsp. equi]|nr:diacylglycerol kinase family lipid kinase [Streptococcus equi subsp. equi]